MIEILDDVRVLEPSRVEVADLSLSGVPFGSSARSFPRDRVVEVTISPIVVQLVLDRLTRTTQYVEQSGEPIPLDRAVASVLRAGGILHFAEHVSFRIQGGRVGAFCLYGRALSAFGGIQSEGQLFASFGRADRTLQLEVDGDLRGLDLYYAGSKKWIRWDAWSSRVAFIRIGGTPDDLRPGTIGGVVRKEMQA